MKKSQNSLTLVLMASSIALLLLLQFFWIRNSYTKAFDDLRKETNLLFRGTVYAMRDSAFRLNTEFQHDSTRHFPRRRRPWDSLRAGRRMTDSMVNHSDLKNKAARVQVFGAPRRESRRNFSYRLGLDSLRIDSVRYYFRSSLVRAGIDLPVQVIAVRRGDRPSQKKGSLFTDPVRVGASRYMAVVSNARPLVVRQIVPDVAFSVFLTLLTLGSFYIMYRGIRIQQRLSELKNDFISNMTHELKTPITTVGVALEALKSFQGLHDPELAQEYIGIAQNELNRLTLLTDNVLKTSIFENQGVLFQPEKVDMEKLVSDVLSSMKLIFQKTGARVTLTRAGTEWIVSGSRDHLTNVLYNLLDNAVKYSPTPATIVVTLKTRKDDVELTVQDSGAGIPGEYQKRIFERFFRVPTGDVHTIKGYGLGLSYVAEVVKSHHGSIEVRSRAGQGSSFIITLPKESR
jgi:two-component system phosphate regulon sensor histidine kinase PhoR